MRIDLHTHSDASDGTDRPARWCARPRRRRARRRRADRPRHASPASTRPSTPARLPASTSSRVSRSRAPSTGSRCTCSATGRTGRHPALAAELALNRDDRVPRAQEIVRRLADAGHPITWADVEAQLAPGATVGRPHIADTLVAAGVVPDRDAAFATLLHDGSPFYATHHATDPVRGRRAWSRRPEASPSSPTRARAVVAGSSATTSSPLLAEAGLAGLEVDHPDHDAAARAHYRALATSPGALGHGLERLPRHRQAAGPRRVHDRPRGLRRAACTRRGEGLSGRAARARRHAHAVVPGLPDPADHVAGLPASLPDDVPRPTDPDPGRTLGAHQRRGGRAHGPQALVRPAGGRPHPRGGRRPGRGLLAHGRFPRRRPVRRSGGTGPGRWSRPTSRPRPPRRAPGRRAHRRAAHRHPGRQRPGRPHRRAPVESESTTTREAEGAPASAGSAATTTAPSSSSSTTRPDAGCRTPTRRAARSRWRSTRSARSARCADRAAPSSSTTCRARPSSDGSTPRSRSPATCGGRRPSAQRPRPRRSSGRSGLADRPDDWAETFPPTARVDVRLVRLRPALPRGSRGRPDPGAVGRAAGRRLERVELEPDGLARRVAVPPPPVGEARHEEEAAAGLRRHLGHRRWARRAPAGRMLRRGPRRAAPSPRSRRAAPAAAGRAGSRW